MIDQDLDYNQWLYGNGVLSRGEPTLNQIKWL